MHGQQNIKKFLHTLLIIIEINDVYSECHKYILWAELKVSVVKVGRSLPLYCEELKIYEPRSLPFIFFGVQIL